MDFDLSDDVLAVKAMCREFARDRIAPNAEAWNREHRFPVEVFQELGKLGLCGPLVPERWGGSDLGMVGYVAAMEELGQGDQSLASGWNAHCTIGTLPILDYGDDQQRARWLRPLASGEAIGSFGLTEPNSGSDVRSLATRVVYDGDTVVITGHKAFITNPATEISYGVVVLGKDADGNFVPVVVENGTPGYSQSPPYLKVGWHALDTRELHFDGARVPRTNVLGDGKAGLRAFLASLDAGRISIAALSLSLAQAALTEAIAYAKHRTAFGQSISKFQGIQFKLARMAAEVESARLLTYRAAWLYDQKRPFSKEAAIAKFVSSETACRVVSEAVQVHGGYGWILDSKVARLYLDSKILEIGEGTNEIQQVVIARQLGC